MHSKVSDGECRLVDTKGHVKWHRRQICTIKHGFDLRHFPYDGLKLQARYSGRGVAWRGGVIAWRGVA